ncbi:MAG: hypothetical protein AVDCRST_MAG77-1394 [uncultured Chloroflexi bacterium]|uniref:Uncharacterized protein n=1 Tax=uncultured Chloroflexota bacterium TaxID=166587 RepID=A0A6J4I1J9_9CHLR|nr:MAG: hypothetical protein AVDCRST_MAG77-1394 [uncultured Chloroflexota bacterium]
MHYGRRCFGGVRAVVAEGLGDAGDALAEVAAVELLAGSEVRPLRLVRSLGGVVRQRGNVS